MAQPLTALELKPRILYEVAKAAWDGALAERREDICRLVCEEFGDRVTRHRVANQIRVAMGLSPHELDTVGGESDADALMGLITGRSSSMIRRPVTNVRKPEPAVGRIVRYRPFPRNPAAPSPSITPNVWAKAIAWRNVLLAGWRKNRNSSRSFPCCAIRRRRCMPRLPPPSPDNSVRTSRLVNCGRRCAILGSPKWWKRPCTQT